LKFDIFIGVCYTYGNSAYAFMAEQLREGALVYTSKRSIVSGSAVKILNAERSPFS